jgi:tetraacyldisaccharide 4'-kinase
LSQTIYLKIISGQVPGLIGVPARLALTPFSWPYSAVVRLRNRLYTNGWLKAYKVGAPVLCVGNLTTGGTGKTPLVVWLCRYLGDKQLRCAILTRGYKTRPGEISDEPALLSARCPGAAVVVNPDRVAGAAKAIRDHRAQVLVMDDGFQHRRLARDLDIIALDATQPFGYGRLLPAGLLREPVAGLRRAHAVVLTRCDQAPAEALERLEAGIRRVNPQLVVARSVHAPVGILGLPGTERQPAGPPAKKEQESARARKPAIPQVGDLDAVAPRASVCASGETPDGADSNLDLLRGKRLLVFCGIGNPGSFFRTVEHLGGQLVGARAYNDHYGYGAGDLARICQEAAGQGADLILTTQKDWTKIARLARPPGAPPLACLTMELQIVAGERKLTGLIDRALGGTMRSR